MAKVRKSTIVEIDTEPGFLTRALLLDPILEHYGIPLQTFFQRPANIAGELELELEDLTNVTSVVS